MKHVFQRISSYKLSQCKVSACVIVHQTSYLIKLYWMYDFLYIEKFSFTSLRHAGMTIFSVLCAATTRIHRGVTKFHVARNITLNISKWYNVFTQFCAILFRYVLCEYLFPSTSSHVVLFPVCHTFWIDNLQLISIQFFHPLVSEKNHSNCIQFKHSHSDQRKKCHSLNKRITF